MSDQPKKKAPDPAILELQRSKAERLDDLVDELDGLVEDLGRDHAAEFVGKCLQAGIELGAQAAGVQAARAMLDAAAGLCTKANAGLAKQKQEAAVVLTSGAYDAAAASVSPCCGMPFTMDGQKVVCSCCQRLYGAGGA